MSLEIQICACNECLAGYEPCECVSCEYQAELLENHRPLTKYALNAELVTLGDDERYTDSLGRYGYSAHFTGAYVCYTCGHLCECGDWSDND